VALEAVCRTRTRLSARKFQSFFYWMWLLRTASNLFSLFLKKFQSFFYWMWLLRRGGVRVCGVSGFVSILLLLDVALEGGQIFCPCPLSAVSILLLLDVALEEAQQSEAQTRCPSFNPSSTGCGS